MQYEDKKFIQHNIQYTVAQCRVGVEVIREKRPNEQKFKKGWGWKLVGRKDQMNRNLKKEGVTWYV